MTDCHCFTCLFGEFFSADESPECDGYKPCNCTFSHS